MGQLFKHLWLATILASGASAALGQKSSEIFIPIGQSPGLSGKHTLIARVQSMDAASSSVTVVNAAGAVVTVRADAKTAVWLDRNQVKLPNRKGDLNDCRKDMTVEVKYRNNDARAGTAEWIKVQTSQ